MTDSTIDNSPLVVAARATVRETQTIDQKMEGFKLMRAAVKTSAYGKLCAVLDPHLDYWNKTPSMDSSGEIVFYLSQTALDTFEDPKHLATLKVLRANMEQTRFEDEHSSYAHSYTFKKVIKGVTIRVHFVGYEKEETSNCKRILIRTETVERPVYRYECPPEDGMQAAEVPPVINAGALD